MAPNVPRLHLPMLKPEDVIPHLGAPHQYRVGRSALLIAEAWFKGQRNQGGLPALIRGVLDQDPRLAGAELVDAFLERLISLGDPRRPSQTDVLTVLDLPDGLAIMAVEGKVDEPFGPRVSVWLVGVSGDKLARRDRLCATLGMDPSAVNPLRYQLLHRTAAAVYEAKRYRARTAVMMAHSFDPPHTGLPDFKAFASAIGLPGADATRLVGPRVCDGVELFLGWCADRASNEPSDAA